MTLNALELNCSLKASADESSSTDRLLDELGKALAEVDVAISGRVRIADHDVRPGVSSDEGSGDAWPAIHQQILDADILVFGTPIWLGHPCSNAQRVLERMDAFLGETDDRGARADKATRTAAANAAHLARLLQASPYPAGE